MERMKICFLVFLLTCAQPAHAWFYTIVTGIAATVVAPYAIPAGLATIGFTSLGILQGSIVSGVMTKIGAAGVGAAVGTIYERSKKSKDQK